MFGFSKNILLQSRAVFTGAYPGLKAVPQGYLRFLIENGLMNVATKAANDDGSGHVRNVDIWYTPRTPEGKSSTEDNCQIDVIPSRLETSIPSTDFRKLGFHIDDDTIAAYEREASGLVVLGGQGSDKIPDGGVTKEIWDTMIDKAQAILADINADLLADQAIAFGVNASNGVNAAKTVNFPLAATNNDLNTGLTMVYNDMMMNEQRLDNLVAVGSGLMNNYILQQSAKSAAQNGLNTAAQPLPKWYYDPKALSAWGANHFGLFDKNAVKLILTNRFAGFKNGDKITSIFCVIPIPVTDFMGNTIMYPFDVQITHTDCNATVDVAGVPTSIKRGYNIFLMSSFKQFNLPADSYDAADVLAGNNGTYRYVATNS
ncbi:MAG: hypothetical protein IT271_12550 [Chitinophagales bacterium]|nr:hypothetical protein [Chitinophagales bacterium]